MKEGSSSSGVLLQRHTITDYRSKGNTQRKKISAFRFAAACLLPLLVMAEGGDAQQADVQTSPAAGGGGVFFVGEELLYEVSYSIFPLGTVRIQILDTIAKNGATLYRTKAFMDSYSGVPFVNLHYVFYSEIDPSFYSHFFSSSDTKDPRMTPYADYYFDYPNKRILYEKGIRQTAGSTTRGSDTISSFFQDGLSLFFFARGNLRSKKTVNVPTFVEEKKVNTYIDFTNKKGSCDIDAVKYPVGAVGLEGRAEFVGVFGLTGDFSGWFSDDQAALPVLAKMKVILGSVRVELIQWNRPGWVPPRAVEE